MHIAHYSVCKDNLYTHSVWLYIVIFSIKLLLKLESDRVVLEVSEVRENHFFSEFDILFWLWIDTSLNLVWYFSSSSLILL